MMFYFIISLLVFIIVSIPVLIQDIKTYTLNPLFIYLGSIVLLILGFIFQRSNMTGFLISAIVELLIFLLVWLITHRKMGVGDIKYSFLCGLICGNVFFVILSTLISSLAGIIFYVSIGIGKKLDSEKRIPFTPFMFFGTVIVSILSLFIK